MVIEHSFVTTREAPNALRLASEFLSRKGFRSIEGRAFAVGQPQWTVLEMKRGRKKAARARNIADLPQVVHLEFDRGRVNVAMSIQPSYRWGGGGKFFSGFGDPPPAGNPRRMKIHVEMLAAIATGLERVIAGGEPPDLAGQPWDHAEEKAREAARKRFRRQAILLTCFLLVIAGLIVFVVMNLK